MPSDQSQSRREREPLLRDRTRVLAGRCQGFCVQHSFKFTLLAVCYVMAVSLSYDILTTENDVQSYEKNRTSLITANFDIYRQTAFAALVIIDWIVFLPHILLVYTFLPQHSDSFKLHSIFVVIFFFRSLCFFLKMTILFISSNQFLSLFLFACLNIITVFGLIISLCMKLCDVEMDE